MEFEIQEDLGLELGFAAACSQISKEPHASCVASKEGLVFIVQHVNSHGDLTIEGI